MEFAEIERRLGSNVVAGVQSAIERAYIASRQPNLAGGEEALEELLVAMLAAVLNPAKDVEVAKRCVGRLRDAVRQLKSQPNQGSP